MLDDDVNASPVIELLLTKSGWDLIWIGVRTPVDGNGRDSAQTFSK